VPPRSPRFDFDLRTGRGFPLGPVGSCFGPVWKLVVDFECEVAAGSEEEEGVIRNCERSVAGEKRFPLADGSLG